MTKHILVIDDREHLLTLLRMILEDERYKVSVLQEGRGAVEHIRESSPDLVILDLKLADASGLDILESLRAQEATADIPVIVYTAAVMEAEAVERVIASNPDTLQQRLGLAEAIRARHAARSRRPIAQRA